MIAILLIRVVADVKGSLTDGDVHWVLYKWRYCNSRNYDTIRDNQAGSKACVVVGTEITDEEFDKSFNPLSDMVGILNCTNCAKLYIRFCNTLRR